MQQIYNPPREGAQRVSSAHAHKHALTHTCTEVVVGGLCVFALFYEKKISFDPIDAVSPPAGRHRHGKGPASTLPPRPRMQGAGFHQRWPSAEHPPLAGPAMLKSQFAKGINK